MLVNDVSIGRWSLSSNTITCQRLIDTWNNLRFLTLVVIFFLLSELQLSLFLALELPLLRQSVVVSSLILCFFFQPLLCLGIRSFLTTTDDSAFFHYIEASEYRNGAGCPFRQPPRLHRCSALRPLPLLVPGKRVLPLHRRRVRPGKPTDLNSTRLRQHILSCQMKQQATNMHKIYFFFCSDLNIFFFKFEFLCFKSELFSHAHSHLNFNCSWFLQPLWLCFVFIVVLVFIAVGGYKG